MRMYQHSSTKGVWDEPTTSYAAIDEDAGTAARLIIKNPYTHFEDPDPSEPHYFDRKTGQGELFYYHHTPAHITDLYSTPHAAHLVTTLLAHAHRVHNGDISYSANLSEYSSPVVLKALRRGWVKENPLTSQNYLEKYEQTSAEERESTRQGPWRQQAVNVDNVKRQTAWMQEMPESDVTAAQEHFRDLVGTSRFKPKSSVSDSQLTLPGMP